MNELIEGWCGPVRTAGRVRPVAWHARISGAFIALGLLMPAYGTAACKLEAVEMPVTMVGMRAVATVGINGTEVPLTVDSGAFFSFLTDAAAQQLNLPVTHAPRGLRVYGLTGPVDARMTTVKQLKLLKGEIPNVDFIVGGNEPGSGTMGLLGRNLLSFTDTEYDLAHGMIRLMFPKGDCGGTNMAYWADKTPVSELALRRDAQSSQPAAIVATVQLNGEDIRVMFDTGATSVVSLAAARRAGVAEADLKSDGLIHGGGRGEAKAWIAPIRKITLDGEAIENSQLLVGDFHDGDADMLIGIDFFLSHRIYVSKSQRRMFFTYNGGPVFALNAAAATESAASSAEDSAGADQPKDAAGYARRGAASAARRDFVHALADLDHACEMAPQVADFFTRRGQVHLALRQFPEALQDFGTALRLDPAQAEARLERAWLRANSGDREGALDDLQALDKTVAPQAHLRLDMAQLYSMLDRPDLALPQWNLWIPSHRKEVDLHRVLNARCWARAMLGVELDKALDDCDEALDRQPKNAAYFDSRAWVRLRRGELRDALSDYERSLKIRPDGAWSLYGRGIVRTRSGKVEQGLADIEAARKLLPSIDAEAGRYGLPQPDHANGLGAQN